MKKAMISISGICANVGITNIEYIDVYISIACSIIICIATLISIFKKKKQSKEIEITQNEEQPVIKEKTIEEQIIETAQNIQSIINSKKGGNDDNGKVH